jgi:hypothetical protein
MFETLRVHVCNANCVSNPSFFTSKCAIYLCRYFYLPYVYSLMHAWYVWSKWWNIYPKVNICHSFFITQLDNFAQPIYTYNYFVFPEQESFFHELLPHCSFWETIMGSKWLLWYLLFTTWPHFPQKVAQRRNKSWNHSFLRDIDHIFIT